MRAEQRVAGNMFGRISAIETDRCIGSPVGCGKQYSREKISMWPDLVQKEYVQSGWCYSCQIVIFEMNTNCTCSNPCCHADIGVGIINCGSQHCLVHGSVTE